MGARQSGYIPGMAPPSASASASSSIPGLSSSDSLPIVPASSKAKSKKKKKLRNLKKLLKAIEDLEGKVKKGEVVKLEAEQQEKLARKPEILKEIFSLEMEVH